MDVSKHKNDQNHQGDDEAPNLVTESSAAGGSVINVLNVDKPEKQVDDLMTPMKEVESPAKEVSAVKELEMTKIKDSEFEEKRKEFMKHISLGDLTKDDPTQPPDYGAAPKFLHNHRNAKCCDKVYFFYPRTVMEEHRAANFKMTSEMLQDMRHDDDETKIMIQSLEVNIAKRFKQIDNNLSSFQATRMAIWDTFKWQVAKPAFYCYISELLALGQNSMLILMIKFINDPDMEFQYGVLYVIMFAILMTSNTLCRQQYIFSGYNLSINIRKALTGILYNKIERLTIKSLTETDSGKVISIISGDLQALTRPMCFIAIILVAPIINLTAYGILWVTCGIEYALITLAWWIFMMVA